MEAVGGWCKSGQGYEGKCSVVYKIVAVSLDGSVALTSTSPSNFYLNKPCLLNVYMFHVWAGPFPFQPFLQLLLDFMLVPPCRPVLVPNLDSQLRRAIDMMYAWCLLTGFEQYEDGQPVIHFCITGGACFLWNEVLGQCWREWGRKDVQGVMIECWRHIHTRRVFGHFHQSERWELMWKSDSLDADASTPPRTFGMYTDGSSLLVI